jgi:hypothetical protein
MQYCSIHGITGVMGFTRAACDRPSPEPGRHGVINSLWTE